MVVVLVVVAVVVAVGGEGGMATGLCLAEVLRRVHQTSVVMAEGAVRRHMQYMEVGQRSGVVGEGPWCCRR